MLKKKEIKKEGPDDAQIVTKLFKKLITLLPMSINVDIMEKSFSTFISKQARIFGKYSLTIIR